MVKNRGCYGPFDIKYAKQHMQSLCCLVCPKPMVRQGLFLNSLKNIWGSVFDNLDPKLCTVEYAQTRQVVETVQAMGKNAWLWAKDL